MRIRTKRQIAGGINLLILSPLLLPAFLHWLFSSVADLIEWAFEDRWAVRKLHAATDAVERAFGVDADSDWRRYHVHQAEVRKFVNREAGK